MLAGAAGGLSSGCKSSQQLQNSRWLEWLWGNPWPHCMSSVLHWKTTVKFSWAIKATDMQSTLLDLLKQASLLWHQEEAGYKQMSSQEGNQPGSQLLLLVLCFLCRTWVCCVWRTLHCLSPEVNSDSKDLSRPDFKTRFNIGSRLCSSLYLRNHVQVIPPEAWRDAFQY